MDFDLNLILVPMTLIFLLVWLVDKFALKQQASLKQYKKSLSQTQEEVALCKAKLHEALSNSPNTAGESESILVQQARQNYHNAETRLIQLQAASPKDSALVRWSYEFLPVLLVIVLLRSFLAEPFNIPSSSMVPTLNTGDFVLVNKASYGLRLPLVHTKILDTGSPERGDVVVFRYPENESLHYIKRVIGLPGDKVAYKKGVISINDQPVKTVPADYHLSDDLQVYLEPGFVEYRNNDGQVVRKSFTTSERAQIGAQQEQTARYFYETLGEHTYKVRYLFSDDAVGKGTTLRTYDEEWETVVPEGHYFVMGDNRDKSADSRFWGYVPEKNLSGKATYIWMYKEPGLKLPSFDRAGKID